MVSSQDGSKQSIDEVEKISDHPNKEGTAYQSELGPKAKRKHFFSPLDAAYAEAVHKDAEFVEFTPEEEVRSASLISMTMADLTRHCSEQSEKRSTRLCFHWLYAGSFIAAVLLHHN